MSDFRINPTPQQAGTATIQQAVYQAHKSSCGKNMIVYNPILTVDNQVLRFIDLKTLLEYVLNVDATIAALEEVSVRGTTYIESPTRENRLYYLQALMNWAMTLYANVAGVPTDVIPTVDIPGYRYELTVYDFNGNTIWDSGTPNLLPITLTEPPEYIQVPLSTPNPLKDTPNRVNIYGIANNPGYIAYIRASTPDGADAQTSAYLINQAAMPESVMAIASLLGDPANTRTYGFMNYGFAARQQAPNTEHTTEYGQIGFYCAYINSIYTIPSATYPESTLIENIFCRIAFAQNPLEG